jgi:hypothetical protein
MSGRARFRLAALAACVAGVALLVGGLAGLRRAEVLPGQVPYIASGALGGLALLAVGITWLLSAESQSEQDRLAAVEEAILARCAAGSVPSQPVEETAR